MTDNDVAIGIDIGGVIIERVGARGDTSFLSRSYLETKAVPGAVEAIKQLVADRFQNQAFLISKADPRIQAKTLRWLDHHHFFEQTGIPRRNALFCRERNEKAAICSRLGITHFIDDRLEVLGQLAAVEHRYLFHPQESEVHRFAHLLPGIIRVESWHDLVCEILNDKHTK